MARARLACLLALVVVAAALAAPAAQADPRFRKSRVTYLDKSTFKSAVAEAVRMWNAAGTPVKLVKARRGKRADITVTTRPLLLHAGRPVAGLGGAGVANGKWRVSGSVKLSASALDDETDAVRANVAAHEFGHALGLPHHPSPCALMNAFGEGVRQSACPTSAGFYRCGPQALDAQALAKLYRGKARFPAAGGVCAYPQPQIEILAPAAEVTITPGSPLEIVARNGGPATWEEFDIAVELTDAAGSSVPNACSPDGTTMRGSMNETSVPPGGTATFSLMLCGQPGTSQDFHLRLLDDATDPGHPFGIGPVHAFRVTFS